MSWEWGVGNGEWGEGELFESLASASEVEGWGGTPSDPRGLGLGGTPPAVPTGAATGEERGGRAKFGEVEEVGEPLTPALSPGGRGRASHWVWVASSPARLSQS